MTKAFDSAVRLLSRREHGALELSDKLKQKGFAPEAVKEALDLCQELGLQEDKRFVELYCRSKIRQGYGPLKIAQELKNKGIELELIHNELQKERENWLDYAMAVWRKKNKSQEILSYPELQKQQRFLLYRGFSMDVIAEVVKELR